MKALIAFLLAFAWSANAAISTATKPHTIDSAATPKVSYVDDNDEALLDKINELIDTTNLHNSSGAVVGSLFSSTGDMRLLIDSDNNGTNRWMVTANGATDTLWRILESGAWKGFGDGYVSGKVVASDSLVGATLRATGNLSAGGTLAVTGASTIAALSATTGSFSSTLGVTGASTLAALSATTGSFSSTLGVSGASTLAALSATTGSFSSTLAATGKFTGSDTVAALLGFRAGSAGATDVSLYRSGSDTWYTPDTLQVGGKIIADLRVRAGTSMPTYSTKRFTAIGNSFDNTALQMENTDVGAMAQGRAFNWGITDVSATEGRLDLTIPSVLTALSVFYNGNVGIGSTTDGGQVFQVTGTSAFNGAATFSTNITQSAGVTTISVTDNTANAVDIQEGSANYINVNTTNSSENVSIGNATTNPTVSLLGTGTKTIDGTINTDLTASRTVVTDGSGNLSVNTETGTGSHMRAASPTTTGTLTGAAANFSGAVSTGALTATTATLGGGEAFTYGDTTFTMTATGMTTSPTGTAYATRIGDVVTLMVPYISGTSNSSSFTFTGIPTGWRPTTIQAVFVPVVTDNSTTMFMVSYGTINSSGVLTLYLNGSSSGWTGSGTKSAQGTITYLLQ